VPCSRPTVGWRSGRGSPSPAALRAATSPRYAPLRGARCMAAARPGGSAMPAPRPDDRAALNLAARPARRLGRVSIFRSRYRARPPGSQSAQIGTAKRSSAKATTVSPSYNTTPATKRAPAAVFNFLIPRKSDAVTVDDALTSIAATALAPCSRTMSTSALSLSRKELWNTLDLVQDGLGRKIGHEPGRIAAGARKCCVVVEGDVPVPMCLTNHARQGGFSALSGTMDQNHRRISQGVFQERARKAWINDWLGHEKAGYSNLVQMKGCGSAK